MLETPVNIQQPNKTVYCSHVVRREPIPTGTNTRMFKLLHIYQHLHRMRLTELA